jgi:hypothetical protein
MPLAGPSCSAGIVAGLAALAQPEGDGMDEPTDPLARQRALSALTAEQFNLQTARMGTIAEANGCSTLYFGALSSTVIALAFVGQASRLGDAFYLSALALLPPVFLLGCSATCGWGRPRSRTWSMPSAPSGSASISLAWTRPVASHSNADVVGYNVYRRRLTSVSAGQCLCGAPPPELNRRPHPYHGSDAKRRANPRCRRSSGTVESEVMCSAWMASQSVVRVDEAVDPTLEIGPPGSGHLCIGLLSGTLGAAQTECALLRSWEMER